LTLLRLARKQPMRRFSPEEHSLVFACTIVGTPSLNC